MNKKKKRDPNIRQAVFTYLSPGCVTATKTASERESGKTRSKIRALGANSLGERRSRGAKHVLGSLSPRTLGK